MTDVIRLVAPVWGKGDWRTSKNFVARGKSRAHQEVLRACLDDMT